MLLHFYLRNILFLLIAKMLKLPISVLIVLSYSGRQIKHQYQATCAFMVKVFLVTKNVCALQLFFTTYVIYTNHDETNLVS